MIDDDFEVLVSTSDFMKLQSKCQQLQLQNRQLCRDKNELSSTALQLGLSNSALQKKIAKFQDHIRYLSEQGIKMAQSLIQKDKEANQLKHSFRYNEIKEKSKLSDLQKQHFRITQQLQLLTTESKRKEIQYISKIKQLSARCLNHQNQNKKQKQQIKSLTILNENMFKQKQKVNHRNKQLTISNQVYKKQLESLKIKVSQLQVEINNINIQNASIKNENGKLKKQQETHQQELKQWKQYSTTKLEKLQKLQNQYMDLREGQAIQIKQLGVKLKQKEKTLQFYEQFYEQNYLLVMKNKENEQNQRNKKGINNQLELKKAIENYFFEITVNLKDMNLSPSQIDKYLKDQDETIRKYIQEVVESVLQNRKVKKWYNNYKPRDF